MNKPKVLAIFGNLQNIATAAGAIKKVLGKKLSVVEASKARIPLFFGANSILIFENEFDFEKLAFWRKNSKNFALIFCDSEKDTGEVLKKFEAKENFFVIYNLDSAGALEQKNNPLINFISYGLSEPADFRATDINQDESGINFKLNYQLSMVPFWINPDVNFDRDTQIYSTLAAIAAGVLNELNLVEISQNIKNV